MLHAEFKMTPRGILAAIGGRDSLVLKSADPTGQVFLRGQADG